MPRTRGGALWRFALAAVLVIGGAAATTAVAGLLQIKNIVQAFDQNRALVGLKVQLPAPGAPETLLLIGSDHRAGQPFSESHTDTMMLVRIDDSSTTINVMSIPRDLAVMLPGSGGSYEGKLNAAYQIHGDRSLLDIIKQQVLPGIQVNHVLDVNFKGFSDLIDAIGCVYSDVDHRYYNNTVLTDYSSIDIQPGYQKLCGANQAESGALAFVRFRHTDSDIVRNARQQDFLRWAKEGYGVGQLISNESRLVHIFGKNVLTDHSLHTTDGIDELFGLIVNAAGYTVKTVPFPEYFGPCSSSGQTPCYVYPVGMSTVGQPTGAERAALRRLLTPTHAPPPHHSAPAKPPTRSHRGRRGAKKHRAAPALNTAGLVTDVGDGRSQAAQLGRVGMPVMYPRLIVSGAYAGYCFALTANCDDTSEPASEYAHSYPRKYLIRDRAGKPHVAYVMTLKINPALGQYYTVQGTTWRDPPIFNSPKRIQVVDGRKLFEYLDGHKIAVAAYHTRSGVYWISNTLANTIPNSQMIAMAASLTAA